MPLLRVRPSAVLHKDARSEPTWMDISVASHGAHRYRSVRSAQQFHTDKSKAGEQGQRRQDQGDVILQSGVRFQCRRRGAVVWGGQLDVRRTIWAMPQRRESDSSTGRYDDGPVFCSASDAANAWGGGPA